LFTSPSPESFYSYEIFDEILEYEINRMRRSPCPITLLKAIFTPSDHSPVVEEALKSTVFAFIKSHMRITDIATRLDNAYFIMLPMTKQEGARVVGGRLVKLFSSPIHAGPEIAFDVTSKIGMGSFDAGEPTSRNGLYLIASEALKLALLAGAETNLVALPKRQKP
jgi:hypothetical protein